MLCKAKKEVAKFLEFVKIQCLTGSQGTRRRAPRLDLVPDGNRILPCLLFSEGDGFRNTEDAGPRLCPRRVSCIWNSSKQQTEEIVYDCGVSTRKGQPLGRVSRSETPVDFSIGFLLLIRRLFSALNQFWRRKHEKCFESRSASCFVVRCLPNEKWRTPMQGKSCLGQPAKWKRGRRSAQDLWCGHKVLFLGRLCYPCDGYSRRGDKFSLLNVNRLAPDGRSLSVEGRPSKRQWKVEGGEVERSLSAAPWPRKRAGGSCRPNLDLRIWFSKIDTWLILPVVICLSQRLSHACLSISIYMAKLRMAH